MKLGEVTDADVLGEIRQTSWCRSIPVKPDSNLQSLLVVMLALAEA